MALESGVLPNVSNASNMPRVVYIQVSFTLPEASGVSQKPKMSLKIGGRERERELKQPTIGLGVRKKSKYFSFGLDPSSEWHSFPKNPLPKCQGPFRAKQPAQKTQSPEPQSFWTHSDIELTGLLLPTFQCPH